jgi:hypothetical protein
MAIEARKSAWGRSWDWKPPIAPMPDAPTGSQEKCIRLSAEGTSVDVSPSHPVALMPETAYVFSARVMTEGEARVRISVHGTTIEDAASEVSRDRWTEFRHEFATGASDFWLGRTSVAMNGDGVAWLDRLSLREADGGPELLWEADVNRPVLGRYNSVDCFMLDQLVAAAEENGIYLQLCMLTRDLYMNRLEDETSAEYDEAVLDAKRFFRYAVARWGYSTNVGAWEYWNEMNPGLPTDRFYAELGQYLEETDVYHHLRKTSTWGPSVKDAKHPKLDVADVHFYLRPSERERLADEVEAVLDRASFLREHAPAKPVLVGEFGLATNDWRLSASMKEDTQLVHFHNSLWASALSGTSGTALFWWWDQLDRMDAYHHYRPLADFLAGVPFATTELNKTTAAVSDDQVRLIGLQGPDCAYLWLFNSEAAWTRLAERKTPPTEITGATVVLGGLRDGNYCVEWWDTREGTVTERRQVSSTGEHLRVASPTFQHDVACKILGAR